MVDFSKRMKSMKGRIQADFTNSKQFVNEANSKGPTLFPLFLILKGELYSIKGGLYFIIQIILNTLISFRLTFSDYKSIIKQEQKELY